MFRVQGRRSQALLSLLTPALLAIFMPWRMGADWVTTGMSLFVAFIIPYLLVGISIPDSFAGERERHTLPTLLASRLPDRAVLFGKVLTSVAFGWVVTLLVLLLSLITVNLTHWEGDLLVFAPLLFIGNIVVSLLVALLAAGVGVLFSLRSSTVRQAQQTTMSVLLVPALVLQFGGLFILQSASGREALSATLGALTVDKIILIAVCVLTLVNAVLLRAGMARFRRARLILS